MTSKSVEIIPPYHRQGTASLPQPSDGLILEISPRPEGHCPNFPPFRQAVPPFFLIRTSNGFFAAGGYALFTAKEARCFLETAFGFVCPPSATLLARQDVPASPW